ncbi:hypothetical protein NKH77_46750 [Streptomyces sp. M19]
MARRRRPGHLLHALPPDAVLRQRHRGHHQPGHGPGLDRRPARRTAGGPQRGRHARTRPRRSLPRPLGYLVAGTGAALFLLFGLLDLWWHSLYGFDAVLDSPPHIGLFVSISITMVGSVIVFAAARDATWAGRA